MARPRWRECEVSLPGPGQIEFINEDKDSMKLRKNQPKQSQKLKPKKTARTAHCPQTVGWHEMNRKQRREMARKIQAEDLSLEVVHPHAAGIDIGNESHYVAVPPARDEQPVRRFGCTTAELKAMAVWLKQCEIRTVAMQSTGVYWIAVYDILEAAGLEVYLVNARETKNLPGRKTDVQESQWLMKLHCYGLLRTSFRPSQEVRTMRTYWRQHQDLVQAGGATYPAHAEGADADEHPVGQRVKRYHWEERAGHPSRHSGRRARSL